jgi:hypothetical protein
MIVASGKATQENALRYMKAMMEMYQNAYRAMPSPLNALEFIPNVFGQGRPGEGTNPSAPGPLTPEAPNTEVVELRRRLEELEAALSRKPAKKARKRKSRRNS